MIGTAAAADVVSLIFALKMPRKRPFNSDSKFIFSFCCSLRQTRGEEKRNSFTGALNEVRSRLLLP
jgi:hypothetical protein